MDLSLWKEWKDAALLHEVEHSQTGKLKYLYQRKEKNQETDSILR